MVGAVSSWLIITAFRVGLCPLLFRYSDEVASEWNASISRFRIELFAWSSIAQRDPNSGLCSSLNFEGRGGFPRAKMSESISDNPNRRLSDGVVAVGGFALDPGPSPRRRQALRSGHRAAVHDPRHGRGSQFLPANA